MYPCPHPGCRRVLKNKSGLTQHRHSKHGYSLPPPRQDSPSAPFSPPAPPSPPPETPSPSPHPRNHTPVVNEDENEAGGGSIVDYHSELDGQLPCSLTLCLSEFNFYAKADFLMRKAYVCMGIFHMVNQATGICIVTVSSLKLPTFFTNKFSCLHRKSTPLCAYGQPL